MNDVAHDIQAPLPRRGIELDVAGADLVLKGHFDDWESGLALGPDLDKVGVRLAVDATSASAGVPSPSLFAFRSRSVESQGSGTYRASGTFTGPGGSKPLEVVFETPPGHSALFVLSFRTERDDFGAGWRDLVENVVPFAPPGDDGPVREAHAWLTAPVLASA